MFILLYDNGAPYHGIVVGNEVHLHRLGLVNNTKTNNSKYSSRLGLSTACLFECYLLSSMS